MSSRPSIATLDLTRRAGEKLLVDRLSFEVPAGVVFGLLGPNGAGKSTTLKLLTGILRPTLGQALVAGVSPWREPERMKLLVGYMSQTVALYDYLTVAEHLRFFANLYLSSWRDARERVREILVITGLSEYLDYPASRLSGGWRQRLALACSILHRPRVLFLDEPTVGVDPVSRRLFWDLLHELCQEGTTVLVTTHYMEEVERCHLVGLLHQGRLRTLGSPRDLKAFVATRRELVTVVATDPERVFEQLRGLPDLLDAYRYGDEIRLTWPEDVGGVDRTRAALDAETLETIRIEHRGATMEDVFVRMCSEDRP
jgi:ABC-2 type transport system ATP-binding protein